MTDWDGDRDLEIAHTKNLVTARIGALTQGAGIEVWMLQNFIRSLGANRETLSRMHKARLLIECINASVRYREPIHFRIEPLRNRGRVCGFVFQSLYGDGQKRLRSITMPSEPQSVSVRSRRQQPMHIARQGPIPNLDPPAAPPITPAMPPPESERRFTGLPIPPPMEVGPLPARGPGFPPPVEGLSKSEEIARYLSLSSLLSWQMRWYSERGWLRQAGVHRISLCCTRR